MQLLCDHYTDLQSCHDVPTLSSAVVLLAAVLPRLMTTTAMRAAAVACGGADEAAASSLVSSTHQYHQQQQQQAAGTPATSLAPAVHRHTWRGVHYTHDARFKCRFLYSKCQLLVLLALLFLLVWCTEIWLLSCSERVAR